MADTNLSLLENAVHKLAPFLDEIVFVGGITLGLLITDKARRTNPRYDRCRCDRRDRLLCGLHPVLWTSS